MNKDKQKGANQNKVMRHKKIITESQDVNNIQWWTQCEVSFIIQNMLAFWKICSFCSFLAIFSFWQLPSKNACCCTFCNWYRWRQKLLFSISDRPGYIILFRTYISYSGTLMISELLNWLLLDSLACIIILVVTTSAYMLIGSLTFLQRKYSWFLEMQGW